MTSKVEDGELALYPDVARWFIAGRRASTAEQTTKLSDVNACLTDNDQRVQSMSATIIRL